MSWITCGLARDTKLAGLVSDSAALSSLHILPAEDRITFRRPHPVHPNQQDPKRDEMLGVPLACIIHESWWRNCGDAMRDGRVALLKVEGYLKPYVETTRFRPPDRVQAWPGLSERCIHRCNRICHE